ncbi:MAG: FHA domain-containing protein [Pseudomonadota bacterium]
MQFRLKGASGAMTGQAFPLSDDTLIGSGADAGVRIEGLGAAHARIVFDGEMLTLDASGPAWINGEPAERQALKSGDEIRLGEQRFVLQAPGLRPPSVLREVQEQPSRTGLWIAIGLAAAAAAASGYWYFFMMNPPA